MNTETRFYLIDTNDVSDDFNYIDCTDDEFIEMCEEKGSIYSLEGFKEAFNQQDISTIAYQLRIIEVPMPIFTDLVSGEQKELEKFSDSTLFSFLREVRHKAFISWSIDDVIGKANEIGFVMNESKAIEIIGEMDRRSDCENGITWDTVSYYVDEWIRENSFEAVIVEASIGEERVTNFCSLETNENIEEFWNDDDYYFYGLSKEEVKSFIGKGEMVGESKIIKVI